MEIKVIVTDLDGTLLNSNSQINPKTKETLLKLQRDGYHLVLASGRPTPSVVGIAKELEMDLYDSYILTFNGAHVMNFQSKEVIYQQPLSVESSKAILGHLESFEVVPMVCIDNTMYVEDVFAGIVEHQGVIKNIIEFESRIGNYKLCEVNNLKDFVSQPLSKILITGNVDYLEANLEAFREPFATTNTITKSADFFVEFTDFGVDKAKSLETILNKIGASMENVIAFGDGMNDLTLIQSAKIGVAMGNSSQTLKSYANYVTDSNDNDGIVLALEHFGIKAL